MFSAIKAGILCIEIPAFVMNELIKPLYKSGDAQASQGEPTCDKPLLRNDRLIVLSNTT